MSLATMIAATRPDRWKAAGVVAAAGAFATAVVLRDPTVPGIWPPCPFHAMTGLHCPGCGSLRAFHELLTGRPETALRLNAFAVLSAPLLLRALAGEAAVLAGRPRPAVPPLRASWIWALLAAVLFFGVARNVPVFPFSELAPRG
jgi:hypothetical protein